MLNHGMDNFDTHSSDGFGGAVTMEASLLSVSIRDEVARDIVINGLTPSHFSSTERRAVFNALKTMNDAGMVVDVITLHEHMTHRGEIASIGGDMAFLGDISRVPSSVDNTDTYVKLLKDSVVAKDLTIAGQKIIDISKGGLTSAEKLQKSESILTNLSTDTATGPVRLYDQLGEFIDIIDERNNQDGDISGVSSGLTGLDEQTNGFQDTDLIIIAGRPGQGKTVLGQNIAIACNKVGGKSLFFSLEMSSVQLIERMVAATQGIDLARLKRGDMDDDEWQKVTLFVSQVKEWESYIDDQAALTIGEICARARALHRKGELDVLIIDYLQLIKGGEGENQSLRIGDISGKLKALAKELNIPVIALSQLSRGVESRPDKRPLLSDLRDSGSIEQDADLIIFVYRDEYYNEDSQAKGLAELILRKHRSGATGEVITQFEGAKARFKDLNAYDDDDLGASWFDDSK